MKKNKLKSEKIRTEEQLEIIKFIRILLIVIVFVSIFYFVTRFFVKKDILNKEEKATSVEIAYDKIVFGMLLNRPYDEYYVLSYAADDINSGYYSYLISNYTQKEDNKYIYYIDTNDSLNKDYIADDNKTNIKATNLKEIKVGKLALFKVNNGKLVKVLDNLDDIKEELK